MYSTLPCGSRDTRALPSPASFFLTVPGAPWRPVSSTRWLTKGLCMTDNFSNSGSSSAFGISCIMYHDRIGGDQLNLLRILILFAFFVPGWNVFAGPRHDYCIPNDTYHSTVQYGQHRPFFVYHKRGTLPRAEKMAAGGLGPLPHKATLNTSWCW